MFMYLALFKFNCCKFWLNRELILFINIFAEEYSSLYDLLQINEVVSSARYNVNACI